VYLTKKQLSILEFICRWKEEKGVSPTLEEVATQFGVSKITIYEHLNQLQKKGAIRRAKFRARSIEVLNPPKQKRADCLPLRGRIQLGSPLETADDSQDVLRWSDVFPLEKNCYALKVEGEVGEQIHTGDYVVVENRQAIVNGETIVAVQQNGEATLRRYYRENGKVQLQPCSESGEAANPEEFEIRGVVVGLVRKFCGSERPSDLNG
jgi:repressor LexA